MNVARLALAMTLMLSGSAVSAHDARPNYVQISETAPNAFSVRWKVPSSVSNRALPTPTLPEGCVADREAVWQRSGAEYLAQQGFVCDAGLAGRHVGIAFPAANPSLSTLYKVRLASGEEHLRILGPGETLWRVPLEEKRFTVAAEYTRLGIEHIWLGVDHLLFVACLMFIARTPRRLLITITGFTVAHSITLILSTLDVIRIPTAPVEAAIALSVVYMAWEIAKGNPSSLTYRFPVAVSSSFGLLHGLGFAAVLRHIGLPQTELSTALLFFNVGVEIGQILFVGVLLVALLVLRALATTIAGRARDGKLRPSALTVPASYVIGGIASYWMIDRVVGFWG